MDSPTGHRCRATQFRIAASDIVGRFRTPHARGVWKVSPEGGFRRSQERQNSLEASNQASIEGCDAGSTSWAPSPCVVGRAQTIGDERRGCIASGRWIGWHCDGGGALRLVSISKSRKS
ncbi:unnamed protein product [Sphagnum troendelagicum]|uniref:Uncharacterized protein n=1 Tax=Sphagnum troendelagicum TaxID=128251 RepID=A0ABP0UYG7_9BRYO